MSALDFLSSTFICFLSFSIVFGLPLLLLKNRFPEIPRTLLLLGLFGVTAFSFYLKPKILSLGSLCLLPLLVGLALNGRKKIDGKALLNPSFDWPTVAILLYSFLLFFFRWEPPGDDPVKWGSLARLILEYGVVPGDARPITPVTQLQGATLGVPLLIALTVKPLGMGLIALERVINFYSCLSLALFAFSIAQALTFWFSRRTSQIAALLVILLFSVPQGYLLWGGTPTLLGMTAGLSLFSLNKNIFHNTVLAFGLSFAAYAHPIGFIVSLITCGLMLLASGALKSHFFNLLLVGSLGALFFCPFLLGLNVQVDPFERSVAWLWQKDMAPYLFRENYSSLYNLYTQMTAYLWNTAAVIALSLAVLILFTKRRRELGLPLWVGVVTLGLLILNVRTWTLPLSYLFYPERSGLFLVFPLSLALGWAVEKIALKGMVLKILTLLLVVGLSQHQFRQRLLPLLFTSQMTKGDRAEILNVANEVPSSECVKIEPGTSGKWIPVLALRCTTPFHGLAMNSIVEEQKENRPIRYQFFSSFEDKKAVLVKREPLP